MLGFYFQFHFQYHIRIIWVCYLVEVVVILCDGVFVHLLIFPPIDVNANKLLYYLIFGRNCFDK
jgi:hypothetical protein